MTTSPASPDPAEAPAPDDGRHDTGAGRRSAGTGSTLAGRYVLGALLGRGGAADVYRADDLVLSREVAVKVLRDAADGDTDRARFVAEARTVANLGHHGLVTVLDAGISGDHADQPFLVMELVDGATISDRISQGPLPRAEVERIGAALADAIAYAHERNVVHRDVKPGNVLLSTTGTVKLADFGIARLIGDHVRHTRTGHAIGTAAYLAPEQVRGEALTTAVDIYSFALVLLEMLTAQRAYPGPPTEAALARLSRQPSLPDDLPPAWRDLLTSMTALDPTQRPTAAEVASRIRMRTPQATTVLPAVTASLTAPLPAPLPAPPSHPPPSAPPASPAASAPRAPAPLGPPPPPPAPWSGPPTPPDATAPPTSPAGPSGPSPYDVVATWVAARSQQQIVLGVVALVFVVLLVAATAAG